MISRQEILEAEATDVLPNSRKLYVAGQLHPEINAPFREISLSPTKLAEAIAVGIENDRNAIEKKQRPLLVADYHRQDASGINVADLAQPPARLETSPSSSAVAAANHDTDPN